MPTFRYTASAACFPALLEVVEDLSSDEDLLAGRDYENAFVIVSAPVAEHAQIQKRLDEVLGWWNAEPDSKDED